MVTSVAALPVNVTVPVVVPRLSTDDGEIERDASSASAKTSEVCLFVPFKVAVIVAVMLVTPGVVVTENVALDDPDRTVTDAGTLAAALFDESVTTRSAAAGPVSVTVPVPVTPPVI